MTKAELLDIAPFAAASLVQIVTIPIQLWIANDLRKFHVELDTEQSEPRSMPRSIYDRFIVDSDFLTAIAAGCTFIVSAATVVLAKNQLAVWVLTTYILLGILSLALSVGMYLHYRNRYAIYKQRSIIKGKVSLLALMVLIINTCGIVGLLTTHAWY